MYWLSLNRYDTKRDANESEIRTALHKCGVSTYPLDSPVDLLCWWRTVFFMLEIKDGSKPPSARKLTKAQEEFFDKTRGCPRFKVESPEEAVAVLGRIGA